MPRFQRASAGRQCTAGPVSRQLPHDKGKCAIGRILYQIDHSLYDSKIPTQAHGSLPKSGNSRIKRTNANRRTRALHATATLLSLDLRLEPCPYPRARILRESFGFIGTNVKGRLPGSVVEIQLAGEIRIGPIDENRVRPQRQSRRRKTGRRQQQHPQGGPGHNWLERYLCRFLTHQGP